MKNLISMTEQKVEFLKELNESLNEENAEVIIDNIKTDNRLIYIAFNRISKEFLEIGTELKIKKYLMKNNIKSVYWRKLN
jgi:16S rRNA G527 N7-methylase RsmG